MPPRHPFLRNHSRHLLLLTPQFQNSTFPSPNTTVLVARLKLWSTKAATVPPQHKGRLPQYNVHVDYPNTSFVVKKPNGGSRLVTSFGQVAQYSKPQPSLMPNVDNVLHAIGQWRYIIVTDLFKSFYQIPWLHLPWSIVESPLRIRGSVCILVLPWACPVQRLV